MFITTAALIHKGERRGFLASSLYGGLVTYAEEQRALDEAVAKFPDRFGLRAFPGDVFRLSRRDSYYGDEPMLYTHILGKDGEWKAFAKGTVSELMDNITQLTPHAKIASSR